MLEWLNVKSLNRRILVHLGGTYSRYDRVLYTSFDFNSALDKRDLKIWVKLSECH